MKEIFKLTAVLCVICLISGSLLAVVNKVTEEPIAKAAMKGKEAAIKQVLPADTEGKMKISKVDIQDEHRNWVFYVARVDGKFVGTAVECSSNKGYGGEIKIMLGINAQDKVQDIAILSQHETPGLGAKMVEPEFKGQFKGKDIVATKWAVKKDQGDIDQITAATISSRAVTGAVKSGIDVFLKHKNEIVK